MFRAMLVLGSVNPHVKDQPEPTVSLQPAAGDSAREPAPEDVQSSGNNPQKPSFVGGSSTHILRA